MMRVLIAEDEQLVREELIYLLEREEDVTLCPEATTGDELITLYKENRPDVIFLDVQMPGKSGIEAAKEILKDEGNPPLFIFTTAYDEYAVEAFEIEAVDYLLKPYDERRFQETMKRLRKKLAQQEKESKEMRLKQNSRTEKLLIDDGEKMIVLSPESIYYAVPNNRMLEIHTEQKVIYSRMTLQELEKKLKGYPFFRPHRSYLVNIEQIQEITPWFNGTSNIKLKDKKKTVIPVSRSAKRVLFKIFER
ncbi:DNA-binding response regulator [Compostibacillus humi]|uniref:DNA-binding response regulator n=2 Tax=Compostibacillus humi TaxID=1245525 RepID=A0A8J2ZPW3_9BACI|nr:DNA-binding response regulator [Compostibacillus humi]